MNERILELAKQCGYWSGQTIEMNDVGIKKFAGLIYKDIIDVVGAQALLNESAVDVFINLRKLYESPSN